MIPSAAPIPAPIRNFPAIPAPMDAKSACPVIMTPIKAKETTMHRMSVAADSSTNVVAPFGLILILDAKEITTIELLPP